MEANETFLTELTEKFRNSETFSQDIALRIITDSLKQYSMTFASLKKDKTNNAAELPFEVQQYLTSLEIENYSKALYTIRTNSSCNRYISIDTTRVYAELADEEIKRSHSKFII